ncbi:MAG: prepilin-type N-terminal cleavage/methylation domain-containing protein [Desulfomicrobium sp.]|nr:prepilin-type N-terminal cleavage/methylation domain-containing protein [Desulfomicrobium sp.]
MDIRTCSQQKQRNASGFTLVEVLVASAILAVGIMGVATMIARSTIQDARSYHTTHASLMVEQFIERESGKQFLRASYQNINGTNASVETETMNGVLYTMNCTISDGALVRKANNATERNCTTCKEMSCIVTWNNKGLQSQTEFFYVFSPKY